MEIKRKTIRLKEGEAVLLMPIGDIQYLGEDGDTDTERLKRHIEWGTKREALFIGMGDYIDFASPSNRQALVSAPVYDGAHKAQADAAQRLIDELYEEYLKTSTGRWLGLLGGHHHFPLLDGTPGDVYLSGLLKAEYLGDSVIYQLDLESPETNGPVQILAVHGSSAAQRIGGALNKLELFMKDWPSVDIFLMGHTHKIVGAPTDSLFPVWKRGTGDLAQKTRAIVNTGGFMRGYVANRKHGGIPRGTYVERKMYSPQAIGAPVIYIEPRVNKGVFAPDIRVSL